MRQVGDGGLEDKKTKAEEAEYYARPRLVTRQIGLPQPYFSRLVFRIFESLIMT